MAKKPAFPTKPCPKCDKPIHARLQKHLDCGWVAGEKAVASAGVKPSGKKKPGRPKAAVAASAAGISLDDIAAVKNLVDRVGGEKVQQLAQALAK